MVLRFADILVPLVTLGVSLAALAYTSRYVIGSVEEVIEITGLSETSVGFALLSVITSTPELLVAVFAVLSGTPSLSVGDLLGSNVFNIGIVVGVLMLTTGFLRECPEGLDEVADVLLLSSIIPLILVILRTPTPLVGCGLLGIFAFSVYRETKARTLPPLDGLNVSSGEQKKPPSKALSVLKIFGGTIFIIISARFTVSAALEIAAAAGIYPILIGALIVAFGTSLPELSLSVMAVKRGRVRLATANAIGSNLTNLTLILGIVFLSSLFSPFSIDITSFSQIISFVLITSLVIWYHMTRGGDCRLVGAVLILTYIVFQAVSIIQ